MTTSSRDASSLADVGAADERPQVTHGQVVPEFDGSVRPIAPFGRLDPRHEGLGQSQHALGAWFRPAFFARPFPLEMQGCAHRRDPAPQELLRDRALFGRDAFEHGVAVGVARAEALLTLALGWGSLLGALASLEAAAGCSLALAAAVRLALARPSGRPRPGPAVALGWRADRSARA